MAKRNSFARRFLALLLAALLAAFCGLALACSPSDEGAPSTVAASKGSANQASVSEDGEYISKDEVALYIHTYGHLPSNFISKTKARNAGWKASEGNLQDVCPGKSIGGSEFYVEKNDETGLPYKKGRSWHECDINYKGGYRGAERLVYSSDGLIYYTGDHYNTFQQLY